MRTLNNVQIGTAKELLNLGEKALQDCQCVAIDDADQIAGSQAELAAVSELARKCANAKSFVFVSEKCDLPDALLSINGAKKSGKAESTNGGLHSSESESAVNYK